MPDIHADIAAMPPTRPAVPDHGGTRRWLLGVLSLLVASVVATPLAGAVGGLVCVLAMALAGQAVTTTLAAAFAVYGALLGGLIALPVTALALPLAALCLPAHLPWRRWLLPALGTAGGWLRVASHGDSLIPTGTVTTIDVVIPLAAACGGLAAGVLFAWWPLPGSNLTTSHPGHPPCASPPSS